MITTTYTICKKILRQHFLIRLPKAGWKKNFSKDLGFSSLEFTELVVYIEDFFNINLPDAELNPTQTLGELVVCIDRHR